MLKFVVVYIQGGFMKRHIIDRLLPGKIVSVISRHESRPQSYTLHIRLYYEDDKCVGWERTRCYLFDDTWLEKTWGRTF